MLTMGHTCLTPLSACSLEDYAQVHAATPGLLFNVLSDLVMGARHMAGLRLIHRDIKPANVLLKRLGHNGTMRAKLADLGLAVQLEEGAHLTKNE